MIDVVFLLLVFFMLAARFGIDEVVPLPLASGSDDLSGPPRLIDVLPEGQRLNGVPLSPQALTAELDRLLPSPEAAIILRGRQGADLQRIVTVTELLRAAGYGNVVLVE